MGRFVEYFEKELEKVKGIMNEEEFENEIAPIVPHIKKILEFREKIGDSGTSGLFYGKLIKDLVGAGLLFEPVIAIRSEEELEFGDPISKETDVRVSQTELDVYKENGVVFYSNAIVFKDSTGLYFTTKKLPGVGISSSQRIKFPFLPKTFYVNVKELEDGSYEIQNPWVLFDILDYYDPVDDEKENMLSILNKFNGGK